MSDPPPHHTPLTSQIIWIQNIITASTIEAMQAVYIVQDLMKTDLQRLIGTGLLAPDHICFITYQVCFVPVDVCICLN